MLEDLDDEEWIYWCIDDNYPTELNVPKMEKLHNWLLSGNEEAATLSSVLACTQGGQNQSVKVQRSDKHPIFSGKKITLNGICFEERISYRLIWLPQYIRVKVLRYLFENGHIKDINDTNCTKKNINLAKVKKRAGQGQIATIALMVLLKKHPSHKLYLIYENYIRSCESSETNRKSNRSNITENCYESMVENNFLPPWNWKNSYLYFTNPLLMAFIRSKAIKFIRSRKNHFWIFLFSK